MLPSLARRRVGRCLTAAAALAAPPAAHAQSAVPPAAPSAQPPACDGPDAWNTPQAPFRLYGNTFYVGTRCLSVLLVTSPRGHVVIDGGLPATAPLVLAGIRALGFRPGDVRLVLNSHAHYDHAGGIAALQRATGAAVAMSAASARALRAGAVGPDDPQYGLPGAFPPVRRVRVLAEGETVRVGPLALTAVATPGHTPGGTSWTWTSCEGRGGARRCLTFVYADSQTPVSAGGFSFTRSRAYPAALADFARGQRALDTLRCDVLVTPHPEASGLWDRLAARDSARAASAGGPALVDPEGCRRYAAAARARVARRVAEEAARPGG